MPPVRLLLLLSCALFCLGVFGVLTRRNAIAILLAIELILNAAGLNFVVFSRLYGHPQAQAFALFVIALAACEAAVGLAIVLGLYRTARTVSADDARLLKG
ncbi:MAG: NADH-quinone oxidoreductase subunit NuoK [Candidatus Omnitrophica bacterium]|nr:NADH-quinone oxidoreductase subunit NuoK [Candidatus Omnitrophota bacterium]